MFKGLAASSDYFSDPPSLHTRSGPRREPDRSADDAAASHELKRLHSGGCFEIVTIPDVQASWFVRHPGLSYRYGTPPQGSRDLSVRAEPVSLPSQASDMLAVRTRQLTAEDLHLIRLAALSAAPGTYTLEEHDHARHTGMVE
jgi:hypothetical protein